MSPRQAEIRCRLFLTGQRTLAPRVMVAPAGANASMLFLGVSDAKNR